MDEGGVIVGIYDSDSDSLLEGLRKQYVVFMYFEHDCFFIFFISSCLARWVGQCFLNQKFWNDIQFIVVFKLGQ